MHRNVCIVHFTFHSSLMFRGSLTFQRIFNFDQQIRKFLNVLVTTCNSTGLKLLPVFVHVSLCSVHPNLTITKSFDNSEIVIESHHLVLDVVLAHLHTPAQAALELLQL